MFADYKSQVLLAYQEKRAANTLSLNLTHSTPAKLRTECETVFNERYLKKDEKTLRTFFGFQGDTTGYIQAIRKFDVDRFKPLDNYLKGNTNDTLDKNIELLAWLIDFEPRPYKFNPGFAVPQTDKQQVTPAYPDSTQDMPSPQEATNKKQDEQDDVLIEKEEEKHGQLTIIKPVFGQNKVTATPAKTPRSRSVAIFIVLVALTGSITYLMWPASKNIPTSSYKFFSGNGGCMLWTGNQYQPAPCNQKHSNGAIMPLDTLELAHLRKITDPDTLTKESLGKVWYVKYKGKVEFYTSYGMYPVDTMRRLRPITRYILNKYIHHM